jgi:hypothetical protein
MGNNLLKHDIFIAKRTGENRYDRHMAPLLLESMNDEV